MSLPFRPCLTVLLVAAANLFTIGPQVNAEEPATKTAEKPAAPAAESSFKRRNLKDEKQLVEELQKVPEFDLHELERKKLLSQKAAERWDYLGWPLRAGDNWQLPEEQAKTMETMGRALRLHSVLSSPEPVAPGFTFQKITQPKVVSVKQLLELKDNYSNNSLPGKTISASEVPGLVQGMQAEAEPSRLLLVELLARSDSKAATLALAQRSLFDLSPKVREAALVELKKRPGNDCRQVLLDGFRHIWPPVADHAAEALVALQDAESLPKLKALLNEPDPRTSLIKPATVPKLDMIPELVRINHFRNCILCHAPSDDSKDVLRAPIPEFDKPLPIMYYQDQLSSMQVRADITYVRQDFSVVLPVANAAPWPEQQRFDFVVHNRIAMAADLAYVKQLKLQPDYPQRQSVRFALEELTTQKERKP